MFYRRDLLRKDLRWLMLVMRRPGYEYRYVWSFFDSDEVAVSRERDRLSRIDFRFSV